MVTPRFLLPVLLVVLPSCGSAPQPEGEVAELTSLLPAATSLAGWEIAEGPSEFSPETLWEVKNGAAPLYLKHGFRRLLQARYQLADDPLSGVTLDVFDMGSPLGAFGVYSGARPREADVREWGAEGYRLANVAAAWKGSVYVHCEADRDGPQLLAMAQRLVSAVCLKATGSTSPPPILATLPADGLRPHSERYVAADLLGHEFLPGGVLATYESAGLQAEVFFSELTSESAVRGALESLRAHHARWGKLTSQGPEIGAGGFRFLDPALGSGVVVSAGPFVAGSYGTLPPQAQEGLQKLLVANLTSP